MNLGGDYYDEGHAMGITKRKTDTSSKQKPPKRKKDESKSMLVGSGDSAVPIGSKHRKVRASHGAPLNGGGDPRDHRVSKSMKIDGMADDNVELLSRDDSINLGLGCISVRKYENVEMERLAGINNSDIDVNYVGGRSIRKQSVNNSKQNNKKKLDGKNKDEGGPCNSCEQVCSIF
jgi:hypothetical protein